MKILYIHQYFHIPTQPGSTRSYWIAQELIKKGHQVTMITANSKAKQEREEKQIDGIKVIYIQQHYNQNLTVFQRLRVFLRFVVKSTNEARRQKDIDLVIATSTPLTVGLTALYVKWFKKIPFVFEVRDLWPEVPIQMGAFKNPLVKKIARWFEKKVYTNAEHVIALSPGMRDGILKYISGDKISMIPNMSKIDKFWPRPIKKGLFDELQLKEDSFKLIHFGALGLANGAHTIIESAKVLNTDPTIEILFVGGGSQEKKLKQICEEYELRNVKFYGRVPMQEISDIVNLCDVSLVSFKDLPILYTNSPNKLFDSLSAGKPVIVNSAGWTKQMVEENNCGFYVNPNFPGDLVAKIKFLQNNPEVVKKMGMNARKLAETKYDKSLLCKEFVEVIEKVRKEQINGKIWAQTRV